MDITKEDLNIILDTMKEHQNKSSMFNKGLHMGFKGGIELKQKVLK